MTVPGTTLETRLSRDLAVSDHKPPVAAEDAVFQNFHLGSPTHIFIF